MSKSQKDDSPANENGPKDKQISELRSKLDSLKKVSKDYENINLQYKELLNNFSLMNEAKVRLEYEIRQRETEYDRRISDLKAEKETMKLVLDDKMTDSEKIYSENYMMEKEIKIKNEEIKDLTEKLNYISNEFDKNCKNKKDLIDLVQNINDDILLQKEQLYKLKKDNECLKKICQENENNLCFGKKDLNNLTKQLNENNYDKQNLNKEIFLQEKNINNLQQKLNSCNDINTELKQNLISIEKELTSQINENDELKKELINERNLRINVEKNNEKLSAILFQRETELNQLNIGNEKIKLINTQSNKDKENNKIMNNKLKKQINILEYQNNNLIKEIDNILEEDKKMKEILNRQERINSLLKSNNSNLERSIYDLDKYINKYGYGCNYLTNNNRFTYYHYCDREQDF